MENFRQPAKLTIEIGGYRTIRYRGQSDLNVLRAKGPEGIQLLTVGPFAPVNVEDWTIYESFLNLVHFTKDGTYKMAAPQKGSGQQKMTDNSYVVISRATATDPRVDAGRFDVMVKDCTAIVTEKGIEGTLRCDGLADQFGNVITLKMTWTANGKPFDLIADAQSKSTTTSLRKDVRNRP